MINDENLKTIIEEVVGNNDDYLNVAVYDIMKKIIDLPSETTTTIADLINYNPNETFVEPLTQGQVRRLVKDTCKKLNIELEDKVSKLQETLNYFKELWNKFIKFLQDKFFSSNKYDDFINKLYDEEILDDSELDIIQNNKNIDISDDFER